MDAESRLTHQQALDAIRFLQQDIENLKAEIRDLRRRVVHLSTGATDPADLDYLVTEMFDEIPDDEPSFYRQMVG